MKDINRITLVGRLTHDPAQKIMESGRVLTTYKVATNYSWKEQGEWKKGVDFHTVALWTNENVVLKEMKKGDAVCVDGKLRTRSWKTEDGSARSTVEVAARNILRIDSAKKEAVADAADILEDDIEVITVEEISAE